MRLSDERSQQLLDELAEECGDGRALLSFAVGVVASVILKHIKPEHFDSIIDNIADSIRKTVHLGGNPNTHNTRSTH